MTEHQARAAKARKLADQLWSAGITSQLARRMTQRDWDQVAHYAGCHPPHSDATREMVYAILDVPRGWDQITDVPCFFRSCSGTLRWAENGYVPGYRICDKCGRHYEFSRRGRETGLVRSAIRHNGRRSPVLPDGRVLFFVPYEERYANLHR